jgi:hypothetical protein
MYSSERLRLPRYTSAPAIPGRGLAGHPAPIELAVGAGGQAADAGQPGAHDRRGAPPRPLALLARPADSPAADGGQRTSSAASPRAGNHIIHVTPAHTARRQPGPMAATTHDTSRTAHLPALMKRARCLGTARVRAALLETLGSRVRRLRARRPARDAIPAPCASPARRADPHLPAEREHDRRNCIPRSCASLINPPLPARRPCEGGPEEGDADGRAPQYRGVQTRL